VLNGKQAQGKQKEQKKKGKKNFLLFALFALFVSSNLTAVTLNVFLAGCTKRWNLCSTQRVKGTKDQRRLWFCIFVPLTLCVDKVSLVAALA
jgi:hypothetical protein